MISTTRSLDLIVALDLPPEGGTYALVLRCTTERTIRVGKLGKVRLQPGYYVYVGSALGPGGLRARIAHHLRRAEHPHWHIDYIREHVRLEQLWYSNGLVRLEHRWAQALIAAPGASAPFSRFGASDCNCTSHLYFFISRPARSRLGRLFQA